MVGLSDLSVQPDGDVSLNPRSQVNLRLEVQLDADHEGGGLVLAVVVNGSAQELAWRQD